MNFWKVFGATLLAMFVGSIISWSMWFSVFAGFSSLFEQTDLPVITPQTILKIDLAETITEAPSRDPLAGFDFTTMSATPSTHLLKVLQLIEHAKYDENIKGLYLNFSGQGDITSGALEELRAAIIDFKQSGKFVVAYNESYSQALYYLASAADKVYLHPEGAFQWMGLAYPSVFMKGAFDKLGLKVEAFRPTVCKYKSAVEPYIRKDMSPENRAQMQALVDDSWNVLLEAICASRGLDANKLNKLASSLYITLPEDALKHGLVDALIYEDEMADKFAEYGVEEDKDGNYNILSLGEYALLNIEFVNYNTPAVGIVYAEGAIYDGEGEDNNVYSANLVNLLKKARNNDNIKAVVLRVNSPGGSALASDVIWREVELLRKVKPVVVSMGSYAASGGYYISAGADAIFADKLTLTGSIGVFGTLIEGKNMLNEKLGITTDVVKTGDSADFGSNVMGIGTRKITDVERKALLRSVDKVYETFTTKVANGRNLPKEKVLEIAQGRVWSGSSAVTLGLADANGGLREAIAFAVNSANLGDKFRVEEVLEDLPPMAQLLQSLNTQAKAAVVDQNMAEVAEMYNLIKREIEREGVQAYCPYTFSIN
ncbi:MAG: signal peptide peptidase SppA [Alistipes sp.]|nr:signal peptide peptidase SppA [Alistipes sp.]